MRTKKMEFCVVIGFMMFSAFLGIGAETCLRIAGIDYWMVPIIGTIIGIPVILIYTYIFNNLEDKDINGLNEELFGKKLGKVINIIILLFVISFNLITFWNMTSFVSSQYLYNTPIWFVNLLFLIPSIYLIIKGPRIMFRSILMLFYIAIILYIISAFGLGAQIKLTNIEPILADGFIPVLKAVYNYMSYMIFPIFFMLIIPKKEIDGKNMKKAIMITYFITSLLVFIIMFFVLGVFGIELTTLYQYPAYHILKRVFIGGFIERMENTLSIQWIIVLFVSTLFTYYYTARSFKDIFSMNDKFTIAIVVVIMYLSQYIFKNNTISEMFLTKYYPIALGIFLFVMPFIIAIRLFYKKRIQKVSLKKIEN